MSHDRDKPDHPVTTRLVDAVRQMKIAAADRGDVVVEMREATRTRLELLAEDLAPVIADVPPDDDRFDFALTSGLQPRFWIDATAHVMMGPDRRTYRFVRDTRLGRVVLGESADRAIVAERIVAYVAERIHERDLAMSGDVTSYRELATGRAPEPDDTDRPASGSERPLDRIERELAALRREAAERDRRVEGETAAIKPAERAPEPAKTSEPAKAGHAEPEPSKSFMGSAQSIANAVVWVLLGVVIGAGALLLAFQNLLVQN